MEESKDIITPLLFQVKDPMRDSFQAVYRRDEAVRRAELIGDISYDFTLALRRGDAYLGYSEITFTLREMPEGIIS